MTKVIFRKWQNGDILALFPELPGTWESSTCLSYEHVGQHGASVLYPDETVPASPEEYADLKRELESIGYELQVGTRATAKDLRERVKELRRA